MARSSGSKIDALNTSKSWKRIAVIGQGKLGRSFASALRGNKDGFELHSHIGARKGDYERLKKDGGPDVILIAVKDDTVRAVAQRAVRASGKNLALILHCSGAQPPSILPKRIGLVRATFHPIQTFPKPDPKLFERITFGVSSDDPQAISWCTQFAKALGGREVIEIKAKDLALYHVMLSLGSSGITLLLAAIEEGSKSIGIDPKRMKHAMTPLLQASLANALAGSAIEVLTGPLKRGDSRTIRLHEAALKDKSKRLLSLYEAVLKYGKSRLG